jgi:hypothetical protein
MTAGRERSMADGHCTEVPEPMTNNVTIGRRWQARFSRSSPFLCHACILYHVTLDGKGKGGSQSLSGKEWDGQSQMRSHWLAPCLTRDQQSQDRLNHCNDYIGPVVDRDGASRSYTAAAVLTAPWWRLRHSGEKTKRGAAR